MAQRRQTYFWLLTLLTEHQFLGRVMMNFMSAVTDAHTTSTSSWEDENRTAHGPPWKAGRTLQAILGG